MCPSNSQIASLKLFVVYSVILAYFFFLFLSSDEFRTLILVQNKMEMINN